MAPVQEIDDNTSCPVGASKRLECQVIGLPRPSVRWYKDGVNITINPRYKFEYTADGFVVLVLENVTAKDQGVYSCRAENSEGSAETVAQLYIKGRMSSADENGPSIHTMSAFKKVENENEMASQSQRRPLMIGSSDNKSQSAHHETDTIDDLTKLNKNVKCSESEEKGTLETKQQKSEKKSNSSAEMKSAWSESDEETQKNEELLNVVDGLLELTKFGSSGRRLTTDSGITSRGSSFSSEPDINISDESIQDMKEYLHGKADALYQPFEHDKVKTIKESEVEIVVARSEKILDSNEKAEHLKNQIMSMANLKKEKYDTDRVNELEASVLAGMYLFDTAPSSKLEEYRHGIPALELLVRKEALENIPDDESCNGPFEKLVIDSSMSKTNTEKSQTRLEYQTAEIIHSKTESSENDDVEVLNAVNIEKSYDAVQVHEEEKLIKIKTVRYVEEDEKENDDTSGRQLDTLSEDNEKILEHASGRKDKEPLDKEDFNKDNKNKHDTETDIPKEDGYDTNITITDLGIETGVSKVEMENSAEMSTLIEANNDTNTDDVDDLSLDLDNENKMSEAQNKKVNENNDNNQFEKGEKVDSTITSLTDTSEKPRDSIDAKNDENKNDGLSSADKIVEDEFLQSTCTKSDSNSKIDEKCRDIYSDSNGKNGVVDFESGIEPLQKSSGLKLETECVLQNKNEMVEKDRHLEDEVSFENIEDENQTSRTVRENDIFELLDHERVDDSEGRIKAGKYLFAEDESSEIDNKHECEHEYHVKHEPRTSDKSNGHFAEESCLTQIDSKTRDKDKSNGDHETESDNATSESENENINSSTDVDSGIYAENEETKTAHEKDRRSSSEEDSPRDLLSKGSSKFITNDISVVDINVAEEIKANVTELRPIEEQIELKSNSRKENDSNRLHEIKNKRIETHVSENSEKVTDSAITIENEFEKHNVELKQLKEATGHIAVSNKSEEVMLYSANENSDTGREFSEHVKDIDLVLIDDTKPEVPNIVNIQNKLKQNEIRTKDASLTEEVENNDVVLKDISEDPSFVTANETKAVHGLMVASAEEFNQVSSENEPELITTKQLVQDDETEITFSKKVTEEIKEDVSELQLNSIIVEENEVSEQEILPQKAEIESKALDLDKLSFAELEQEVTEQQVIPENTKIKSGLPDLEKLRNVEKDGNELQETMKSQAPSDEVAEECIVPEIANKDKSTPDKLKTEKLNGKTSEPKKDPVEVKSESKIEVLLDDTSLRVSEGVPVKLLWKIGGTALSNVNIYKNGHKVKTSDNIHVDISDDIIALLLDNATVDDEAIYSIRIQDSKKNHGEVELKVDATITTKRKESTVQEEPQFVVEPIVDVKDGRSTVQEVPPFVVEPIVDVKDGRNTVQEVPQFVVEPVADVKDGRGTVQEVPPFVVEPIVDVKDGRSTVQEKPQFVVEPVVDVKDGRSAVKEEPQFVVEPVEDGRNAVQEEPQFVVEPVVDVKDGRSAVQEEPQFVVEPVVDVKDGRSAVQEKPQFVVEPVVDVKDGKSAVKEEPQFVVEPVVDVKDGRRLSIKCSVTGFPAPEVTWYRHGQQLDQDALWEIYSKDGYHYLSVGDPSALDCEEVVCHVKNDLGSIQKVVRVKRNEDEVCDEPVLSSVSTEPSEVTESAPSIEIEISEINTANLRKLPLARDYTDRLNGVTLNVGDVVQLLACEPEGTVLARNIPGKDKVCYIPKQALAVNDVSSQVCESEGIKNNSQLSQEQLHHNKDVTMPERRKMKSPSPKMTSTPKMKRKEMDTESTEELQKRLGFSDNLAQRKEFSTKDSVEFTEYNDGTTRPMFKKRLKSVTAKSGETAQLECTVSGSPLPKILWLKNNRPLKASDGCKVIVDESTNILVFPQAREEDVGIYTARAMNVNGSIMCSAEFTLSDGRRVPAQPMTDSPIDMDFTTPTYVFEMSTCHVTAGTLARFDCRVVAYPKPEIVWMKEGKVLESGERFKLINFNNEIYSLLIKDVTVDDSGKYTCWARNKFGEAMTDTQLNVLELEEQEPEGDLAPKFLTKFYDQQTTEGTATDFKCMIAGRPEPSVTWLLDDLEICEDKDVKMRRKGAMVSLEIRTPKVDQSGTYTCQLSNPLGEAKCSAKLTVIEDKLHGKMLPKFLKKFDHVTAKEGEEAKFTSVIVGEPRPDVTWFFDHKPISDTNRRFQMKKEGDAYTLVIKNVRFDDAGKITCKASNEEGEVYCSANLQVRESKYTIDMPEKTGVKGQDEIDSTFGYIPTFTKRLQDLEVKEGSKAKFECKVMGIPDPDVTWMKDGRVISPGGRYHMTLEGGTGQLVIDNVTSADTGVYTCIVSNSQGKSSSTAALKLEEPKKERYTPDRLLEERTSRKDRYTPDKYLLDDSTSAKRPYLDTDRYDKYDAKVKKSYESPLAASKLEDSYVPRPKKKYDSPKSSYDSFKPKYDTSYDSPLRQYDSTFARLESPVRQYDTYKRYESPVRQYDTYKRYESPVRQYEGVSTKYESPVRPYESISTKYESPVRPYESISTKYESPVRPYEGISSRYESPVRSYESISTRYESPVRMYDTPRTLYESPKRRHSLGREEKIKAVPKIPFDRPALLNKRDDSVQLSWLPAPTYDLPEDARHVSYVIESREVPSRDWTKVASAVQGTSFTVRHLRPDKEYEFRVRAQNKHGASEPTWNATLDKRVDETSKQLDLPEMRAPPRLPTHRPIITDLGEETLRLAWRPVEAYQSKRAPPVSYRLEAKELPGKDWMPLSSRLRDTTHYLSELPHDRDYMIRVRAENDFGISEPTEPLWLPRATAFPGVPVTRPEIIDYEDTRAKLSWSRVDIPAFGMGDAPLLYMLEVEEPPLKDWRTIARDLDDTEYIVDGLKPGSDYRFRVRAKTPTGIVSEPSPAVSLYTKLAQSRAPVDRLEVLDFEPDTRSVNLSWDRVHIPPYNADEEPLMYMLEYQEPPLPEWKTLVTGIPTTRYRVMHLDRERDYNFRVRALTSYGVSPPSPALPVTMRQTPGAVTRGLPEKVVISEVEPHSLRLTWKRPLYDLDKPISYQIEMLEPPFSDWKPIATRVLETTYKVSGLKPTRDYQFRVIPHVDTGYLAPSPSAALTTMPVKPRLPYKEPKLSELTPESVQLSWGAAELPAYQRKYSPIHYKVEMAELPSSNWVPVARRVPETTYNVTGLKANQEYKFRIFAESDSGLSEPSMPTTLYRKPAPKFQLKEPSIRDMSQNIVHLTWSPAEITDSTESVSYMVEMQTPPGISSWSKLYRKHPSPSVRLADLRPDLDYLVRVRAQCGSYLSEPTLPVYIPRRAAPPRLPTEEPYAVDISPDYVKLQWRSADLPTHIQDYAPVTYRLEAQEFPDTNWVSIARGIQHTDFKVTGLNPQKDYNFRVRAENEYGLSDPTHPMTIRKRSVAPILPTSEPLLYDVGPGSARLSWRPATLPSFAPLQSPITYTLFVQEYPFKSWRPLVKGIPHTSYYVSGLQPDKDYMFRVQADNQFGSSKPTESVRLPIFKDFTRPVSVPEVSDFDEDLTSVKLRWSPTRVSPPFDTTPRKYTVETWEPVRREWKPVARGVPDTTYKIRELPKLPDHLFRVRMETEEPSLSEPSLPVSLSKYRLPRAPMYRPQLYEVDEDSVRLSWQPVHVPEGVSRRSVRYTIEQREIPEPHWSPSATDIMETSYKVRGLRAKCDYEFRVKAMYDGTFTEPSHPVSLFRRAVIPTVKFDAPEVYDVEDTSLSLRWNTVDVPAFTHDEDPLLFIIERQTLPSYEWQPVATNVTDKTYTVRDLQPYQDYNFRVRGVYPSGYTEPSPYVPVYRRPIQLSVPVARTEVWEEEPSTARLRWHRAYIPRYYSSTPISYRVEMQEAGETDTEWKSIAADIRAQDYTVQNISPRKDYRFRIRAQTENGDISEPTPPIQFYRTRVPLLKDSENALAEFKPVEYKAIFLKHPYYEQLTKYVPPTLPIHKPDMIVIDQETIELSWRPAIVAEAIRGICNLTYTIEVRCPPSFEWRQLVTGLKVCSHTVQKLHPRIDYIFRVRAWNEYGCSDAGLPVSLYRPAVYKIEGEDFDDEEFEREWERKYGTKVPPKLPIDTPRTVTQTSDSIWFTWLPARIPAYATQTNISYVVEVKEPPSTAWQRDAADLVDCQYVKEGLNPNQEYHIRVRAETEFGSSDATMPIIIRGKGSRSGSRRSSVERDERGLEDKIDLSYLDNVMAGVPPRMASSRPLSSSVGPDRLTLTWSPCRTPSYVKASSVTYIIEKREPPGHVWTVLAKDITGHKFEVTGLNPEQDYMFRIRARNEFGLSDPTLPMTLFRERDDYVPPRVRSRSSSRDSISMLVSKVMRRSSSIDYSNQRIDDDRSSQERIPCIPQYITTTYDTQYGVLGKKGKIQLEVRGYPLPTVHWYQGEEKIEYGGRFNAFVTPTGGITLEIKDVGLDTVGQYKCYAENGSGAAVKMVTFELAEPPTVIATIKDTSVLKGDSAMLTCRVDGFPSPTVKWMKDWRPLADCTRTKMVNVPPETFSLEIVQLIEEDEGLYACTVENIAGKVTVTGRLKVEIDSFPDPEIKIKTTPIEEHYHVLEEIGRGRYGVVRRVVEISTGKTFAANFMSMRNKAQKNFFMHEYEVLRSVSRLGGTLRLYDAFETDRSLIFITEILTEPELLEKIITDSTWTESKVSSIIKKLLAILQELSHLKILHLDIKPSNIRMCGDSLDDIKLIGFGLSRILQPEEEITHNYGSVGYASPEQVTNGTVTANTDMWSVGVLAYLLLSGNGPFTGSSEIEILNYMSECSWTFEGRGFEKFSKEGQDFISKVLVKDPSKRMTVAECLNHPWMSTESEAKINTEQLKQFYNAEKLQRATEKVFTTVQLQSFAKLIHGVKALYQPAVDIESGEIIFPDNDEYGDYLDEDAWYEWQLQYLDDPDSQIFPIQDKKFTVRECRHAGAPKYTAPKQTERSDKDILDTGTGILFRDKIQPTTFLVGEDVTFMSTVVSETGEVPVVTWYRDEQLLSDDYRADASFNPETGLAKLKIVKSKDYDAAVYKCVARIKEGRVSCEARLLLGDVPSKAGRPLVTQTSGTEAFLTWTGPVSDGNAYLLGYRVDYRKEGEKKWTQGPYVTEEYALLTGLEPSSTYVFRVSVHNKYGASPFSWSSLETKTLGKEAPKVSVAADLQPLMQFSTFDKQQLILPSESRRPSLTVAEEPKINESDPNENFTFAVTISKGSYGEYKLCTNKTSNQQCVAKIVTYSKDKHANITAEFELLRTLRQANLVTVLDSYISGEQFYVIYEFLSGINIVQYLCLHKTYKEETVARLVRQVLDALQYLEHFGIVHLNLQPSSMVMATRRRPHVKLRDFTLAQKVEGDKGIKVPLAGYPDFTPPEVIKGENVMFTADLWTLGALTFTLLSGVSPFGGKNLEETLSRILFDRYSTKEMYDNVTKESVKFVGKLLSRLPRNRPTVTKCINSSWLNLGENMVSARNSKMFKSEKLRAFSVDYLTKRSDLNYSLALVDIEKLPKITTGPLIQPILIDKISNRLENLTKIKSSPIDLAESLKIEVSKLPDQPLLEKLVSKIEKDAEIKENVEAAAVEDQMSVAEEKGVKQRDIAKATDGKDQTDTSKLQETETPEVTEVKAAEVSVSKLDDKQVKQKTVDTDVKVEAVENQKLKVEERKDKTSVIVHKKPEETENKEQLEVSELKAANNAEEVKGLEVDSKEVKEENKSVPSDIKKVVPKTSEEKEEVKAIDAEVKENRNTTKTTDISSVKGPENGEEIIETKDINIRTSPNVEDTKIQSTCEAKDKETLAKGDIGQNLKTEQILDSANVVEDKIIENEINKNEGKDKEIGSVQKAENESEEKWEDAVMEIKTDTESEKLTDSKQKEEMTEIEDNACELSCKDIEIKDELPQEKLTESIEQKIDEDAETIDDFMDASEQINESEIKENIERSEKKEKSVVECENENLIMTQEASLADEQITQTETDKEIKDEKTENTKTENMGDSEDFTDGKEIEHQLHNTELSEEKKDIEISKLEEAEVKDKLTEATPQESNKIDETLNSGNEISKEELKEVENTDKVHNVESKLVQQNENNEVVEERVESVKVDKKQVALFQTENADSETEKEEVICQNTESTKMINELAETAAEEISKATLEEIASVLNSSEESKQADIQVMKEEASTPPVSEETITPELKQAREDADLNKVVADQSALPSEGVPPTTEVTEAKTDSEVVREDDMQENIDAKAKAENKEDKVKPENVQSENMTTENFDQEKQEQSDKTDVIVNEVSKSVDTTGSVVDSKNEIPDSKLTDNVKVENELKTESVEKSDDSLQDEMKSNKEVMEEIKMNEGNLSVEKKTSDQEEVSDVNNVAEKEVVQTEILGEAFLKEATSERLLEVMESTSIVAQERSASSVTEEGTVTVSAKNEIEGSADSVIVEQEASVESISTPLNKESVVESDLQRVNAELMETVEKQETESADVTATDVNVASMSMKEETVSTTVLEQVDGVTAETKSVTQTHETFTDDGEALEGVESVTVTASETEEPLQESSVVESSESNEISVTQKRETLIAGEESVEKSESLNTVSVIKEEYLQESSSVVESSESKEITRHQRQETLIAGNTVADMKEDVEVVSSSLVEECLVESAVSSSLEMAKVTESRETVREFITNDLEIEEMKKELLEDLEISSADCGKYLMGSHEDISSIKEKIEKKPDEEEIEKETTNRYIDDALMFC